MNMADKDKKFLNSIITVDKTWCFLYDAQTKWQSSEWKSSPPPPRSKKILSRQGQRKGDAGSFFNSQGIIHYEFIPQGITVNKEIYTDISCHLMDAVRRKHPEKWRTNSWFLLHDNALAYQSVLVKDFLANKNFTTL